jgi:hypothetical protein
MAKSQPANKKRFNKSLKKDKKGFSKNKSIKKNKQSKDD